MAYTKKQKKISNFTTDTDITNDSLMDYIKNGVNKKLSWADIIAKIADVYGLGIRLYETESAMVADTDLAVGDHAIVEGNRYGLYEVGNTSPTINDVALSNGLTAVKNGKLGDANSKDYAELKSYTPDLLQDGEIASVAYRLNKDDGGGGSFRWDSSDNSANVTNDPGEGVYIAPNSDATGASGCWARDVKGFYSASWWGVLADGVSDSSTALNYAHDAVALLGGGEISLPPGSILLNSAFNHTDSTVCVVGAAEYATTLLINHTGIGYNLATNNEPRVSDLQILRSTIGARNSRTGTGLRVFGNIAGGSSIQAKVYRLRIRGFNKGIDLYGCFLSKFYDLTLKENDISYYLNNNTNDSNTFTNCASNLSVYKHVVADGGNVEVGASFVDCEFENAFAYPCFDIIGGNGGFFLQFERCYLYENNIPTDTPGEFNFFSSNVAGRLTISGSGLSTGDKQQGRIFYGRKNASTASWYITIDNCNLFTWRDTGPLIDIDALAAGEYVRVSPSCIYRNVGSNGTDCVLHQDASAPNSIINNKTIGVVDTRMIKFPSSLIVSSDANTLDAYIEGTFTPFIHDDSVSDSEGQTYSVQVGSYTRIGNTVFAQGRVALTSLGTLATSEQARIGGLPYASSSTSNNFASATIGRANNVSMGGAYTLTGTVSPSTTSIFLNKWSGSAGDTDVLLSELTSSGDLFFSLTYRV